MKKIILSLLLVLTSMVGFAQTYAIEATETAENATTVTIQFRLKAVSTSFDMFGITIYMNQSPALLDASPAIINTLADNSMPGNYEPFTVKGNLPGNQFSLNTSLNSGGAITITTTGIVMGTATFTKIPGLSPVNITVDVSSGLSEVYEVVGPFNLVPHGGPQSGTIVLPLEWLSFKATPITTEGSSKVALTWETASEKSVTDFNVERSDDGKVFTKIGAAIPANNKVTKSSYTAYDDKPLNGVSYYRIRQTDTDGKTTVTKIESVTLNSKKAVGKFTFYPNPIQKGTPLSILTDVQGAFDFKVIDMMGRVMYNQKLQGNTELKGLTLAGGTYLYEILSGDQRVSGKIFVAE